MTFVDIVFPLRISFGAQSEPMWLTDLTAVQSGREATNQNWQQARHSFDVSFAVRTASDYTAIRTHFHQVRGRAKSFPFRDPLDFSATASEGVSSTTGATWSLRKRYGTGSDAYDRPITRPVSGTIAVFRTRAGVTTNVTGSATITYTTGAVVMAGHVAGDTYTWSGSFMVPCRYDTDKLPASIVNRHPGEAGDLLVQCNAIHILEVLE